MLPLPLKLVAGLLVALFTGLAVANFVSDEGTPSPEAPGPGKPVEKEKAPRPEPEHPARETFRTFLARARAGKVEDALKLTDPGTISEQRVREFLERVPGRLDIVAVYADDKRALLVTSAVQVAAAGVVQEGPFLVPLVKKDKRWLMRDLDFEPVRSAQQINRFLERNPRAKQVP